MSVYDDRVALYEETDISSLWSLLRARYGDIAPVWIEPGVSGWLLLTWEANRHVLMNDATFAVDTAFWREFNDGTISEASGLRAINMPRSNARSVDGAVHRHYRASINAALKARPSERIIRDIGGAADYLISRFSPRGAADIVADYAVQLPAMAVSQMMGVPTADGATLCRHLQTLWDGGQEAAQAYVELMGLLDSVVAHCHRFPGNNMTTAFIRYGLNDVEVRDQLGLVIAAGHDPAAALIANALALVLSDDTYLEGMTQSQTTIQEAISASLWLDPPITSLVGRFATEDTRLFGVDIRRGDVVVLGFGAAHQDLLHRLDDPTAISYKSNSAHLVYGAGAHRCPADARTIAQVIVEEAVSHFLKHLPDARLASPRDKITWRPSMTIRAPQELPVLFTPTTTPLTKEASVWAAHPSPSTLPTPSTGRRSRPRSGLLDRLLGFLSPR